MGIKRWQKLVRPMRISAREIERREWWLWVFASTVTLALVSGIVALTFPGYHFGADHWFWSDLKEPVRGLAALVLLFDIYTVYQHRQLQRLRKQLADRNQLFQLITENAADMIAVIDSRGHRLYNSPAYSAVLGYSGSDLESEAAARQIHPGDRARVFEALDTARLTGRGQRLEYRMRHKNGSWLTLESTASTICGPGGTVEKLIIVNRDITERKNAEQMLVHRAFHDPLTNLPNRALFLDRVQHVMLRARRHPNSRFAVLLIDIDGFKVFNDSLGHSSGDQLLVQIGARLSGCFRETDTVSRPANQEGRATIEDDSLARLGGDEFTVLLEDIQDAGDAVRVGQRIQDKLGVPFVVGGQPVVVSASIGIALSTTTYAEAENLVRDAELAMYRAKGAGKARCELFDPAMHASVVRRLKLETDLRQAIERKELAVYYQPIISLKTGQVTGFEALSRWPRPDGLVPPAEFIPVANETGMIIPINRTLLRDACFELRAWQSRFPSHPPLTMCVNITPRHFAHPELVEDIRSTLAETGVDPRTLQLEIVETLAAEEGDWAARVLVQLKAIGVRFSIDDFGTGYSSLSRLQKLPVDTLKIDRTLTATIEEDSDSREIVRLIITMARALDLHVVAEGIETDQQMRLLRRLGCEMAQGFLFSRPAPAENMTELLMRWKSRNSALVK